MYVGPIPTVLIVQFSDRTQLAMTPSDTGRASSNRRINFVAFYCQVRIPAVAYKVDPFRSGISLARHN
ncbi:hypothetical protein FEZ40_05510 [Lacticaseibacillus paracasei]|nr:hypothetical protein FEZ40_05510 [Lacticaseibacillus paracasei]